MGGRKPKRCYCKKVKDTNRGRNDHNAKKRRTDSHRGGDPRCGRGDGSMRPLPLSAQDPVCHRRPVSEIVSCPQPCAYSFTVAVDGFMLFI